MVTGPVPGTMQVLEVHLRGATPRPRVVVARVPGAGIFNDPTKWDAKSVVIAESSTGKGLIWKVDIESRESPVAISDPAMSILSNASIQIGINGVKYSMASYTTLVLPVRSLVVFYLGS